MQGEKSVILDGKMRKGFHVIFIKGREA